ncbi:MAG: hypothetical protein AVDCRST_MAG12-1887, partial [uncultured Rubrobacteraceae bacterium]
GRDLPGGTRPLARAGDARRPALRAIPCGQDRVPRLHATGERATTGGNM